MTPQSKTQPRESFLFSIHECTLSLHLILLESNSGVGLNEVEINLVAEELTNVADSIPGHMLVGA